MQMRFLVIGLVLAALAIGGVLWFRSDDPEPSVPPAPVQPQPQPAPEPAPAVVEPIPEPLMEPEEPPAPPLPGLDESDAHVRAELMTASPALGPWLDREDLVRRFTVVLDNASRGDYPRRQLAFLAPSGAFPVRIEEDLMFVDPAGYARFDDVITVATSVDPAEAAALLEELAPLFAEALGELGVTAQDPKALVLAGIDQALATPTLTGDVELTVSSVLYEYADPDLEALPPLQKQLLRMGPDNVVRLQTYLRAVREGLTGG